VPNKNYIRQSVPKQIVVVSQAHSNEKCATATT
jgi:hypothetical protein